MGQLPVIVGYCLKLKLNQMQLK